MSYTPKATHTTTSTTKILPWNVRSPTSTLSSPEKTPLPMLANLKVIPQTGKFPSTLNIIEHR